MDSAGPKLDASNVAMYYFQHDKEYWVMTDFKLPRPPFDNMWVEYRYPKSVRSKEAGETEVRSYDRGLTPYFGCFVSRVDYEATVGIPKIFSKGSNFDKVDSYLHGTPDLNGWLLKGSMYYVNNRDEVERVGDEAAIVYTLDSTGMVKEFSLPTVPGESDEARATRAYYLHPVLLAFSFRNCCNREEVQVVAPPALQKARVRRGKEPLVSYRVINILPMREIKSPRERRVESEGEGVALHIRGGNFACYGPKFGRKAPLR